MSFLDRFYPDECADSAYSIDYEGLFTEGFRGIIFDIDNTLEEHGKPATEKSVNLFKRLRSIGFDTCVISNNREVRVAPFANAVGTKYIYDAHKPSARNYIKAMQLMGTDAATTIFIGDQLFTDVWGANKSHIRTYLVKPIDKHEEIQIVLKRYLERIVLYFYRRNNRIYHEKYK